MKAEMLNWKRKKPVQPPNQPGELDEFSLEPDPDLGAAASETARMLVSPFGKERSKEKWPQGQTLLTFAVVQ